MLVPVLLFILGLVLLIKGGDWFVEGAVGIAHRFHVPELLIGATVVSLGTTLPEVMVSATSAVQGHGEIAYGNAVGSIICNTALIAAVTVAVRPGLVDRRALRSPVAFFFFASAVYCVIAYGIGRFSRLAGILLLAVFAVYMAVTVRRALTQDPPDLGGKEAVVEVQELERATKTTLATEVIRLVAGAALIAVGARLLVSNGTKLAQAMGVPESVIALTFVALGTSLPELVTAITSLAKGHGALSLGNIIGANLFNLVLVSGLAMTLSPFDVPAEKLLAGHNASLIVDVPLANLVMLLLTVPALVRGRLTRWQGILLLVIYAAFCVFQFA